MLRISRLTDYGTVILVYLARQPGRRCSASDVAAGTHVALPTAQKLLKVLARAGLVVATRGAEGGYALARPATQISAADIVDALEGPVAITECSTEASQCELESLCLTGGAWQRINQAIRDALAEINLAELNCPPGTAQDERLADRLDFGRNN
ncbi:MAG: SUF system Fe-S cluster assembly regulator [Gammaproteobacteria bacterium]|nr:MAG: SUF system Fe-S cluster assembly regulator [Gammaproteobacteria bacterium]